MNAFYLASNGLLYRNPLVRGPGYLVIFDGDEEPELVIAAEGLDATRARMRAVSILEQSGLAAVISGPPRRMLRAYDPDGTETRDSFCFWLEVGEPIPCELLEAGLGLAEPAGDSIVISYGKPWGEPAPV